MLLHPDIVSFTFIITTKPCFLTAHMLLSHKTQKKKRYRRTIFFSTHNHQKHTQIDSVTTLLLHTDTHASTLDHIESQRIYAYVCDPFFPLKENTRTASPPWTNWLYSESLLVTHPAAQAHFTYSALYIHSKNMHTL